MTATDELRAMLDERGVEWTSGRTEVSRKKYTHFCPDAGMSMGVWEGRDGKLGIDAHTNYLLTPAQAIAATLGAGTCHVKAAKKVGDSFGFSLSCGHSMVNPFNDRPDYCPWCGAKVVDE